MQKNIRRAFIAAAVASASLFNASNVAAQPWVGQSFLAPSAPNTLLTSISMTGLSGNATANPFLAQIFAYNGAAVVGPALFSLSLGSSFTGGFSLAPNLNLTAGGSYVVLATAPTDWISITVSYPSNSYADGEAVNCFNGNCGPVTNTGNDVAGFSLQFAPTTTVAPEPGTWALSAAGLLMVGFAARRRKQQA